MKFQELSFKTGYEYIDNHGIRWVLDKLQVNFINATTGVSLTDFYTQRDLLDITFEINVAWDKIPVDTKIFVRDFVGDNWIPRHFACYKNGIIMAFREGKTSFTSNSEYSTTGWAYGKLADIMD